MSGSITLGKRSRDYIELGPRAASGLEAENDYELKALVVRVRILRALGMLKP